MRPVQRGGRDAEQVEAVACLQVAQKRSRFRRHQSQGPNLALAKLLKRHLLVVVGHGGGDFQKIEKTACRDRRAAAAQIDIYSLVGKIGDRLDVCACQKVKFFVVEFGDIGERLDPEKQPLLPRIIKRICLHNGEVDAAKVLEVSEVLQRSFADNGNHAPCRSVVDNADDVCRDPCRSFA